MELSGGWVHGLVIRLKKKMFLKISQSSQENICAGVTFAIKLQAGGLQLH